MTSAIEAKDVAYGKLVAALSLEEKVRLLTGASAFTLASAPAIGLREIHLSDGPTGVRGPKFLGGPVSALLPNATLLSAAWDEDTAYEAGQLLAEEAKAQGIHVVLGPTINLHRSPLGGRLFEAYSEDPLLTGKLAAACVRGLQDAGVGATPKHLVANESETERNTVDCVLDEATLRELYLLPFEIAVAEANPWSIMAAYNEVNGVAATEQRHVNVDIVKREWGWDGLLMSDWFATRTAAAAANGGLDLVMPGPYGPWGEALVEAVNNGLVDESVIDDKLVRLLRLAGRVGALAPPPPLAGTPAPDSPQRREQLIRLAARGMTVLRNRRDVLPLEEGVSVALIGRHALETTDMGGGSAQLNPPYQVSVAQGLAARLGDAVAVVDGVEVRRRERPARPGDVTDPETGAAGTRVTLFDADGRVLRDFAHPMAQVAVGLEDDLPRPVSRVRIRARIAIAGPARLGALGIGTWTMRVGDRSFAFELVPTGTAMGEEILYPPLHVESLEVAAGEIVEVDVSTSAGVGLFGLVAAAQPRDDDAAIAEARAAAAASDVTVVVVGLTEEDETESVDKATLRLPLRQDDLVRAVAAAARRTVVVVNAATPVLMPWLDEVDAVLWAGLPGQEGGHAVAAALLGDVEPSGRLVTSFPAADGASPAWSVTPLDGRLAYAEGTFIGYRGYAADKAPPPAFWFGHGLGYGSWRYEDVRLVALHGAGASREVALTVRNTGMRRSREVVQVYLQPVETDQPVRLVGWQSITLDPGAGAEVRVPTEARMWRRWDAGGRCWSELAAGGELLIARGLGDVRARLPLG